MGELRVHQVLITIPPEDRATGCKSVTTKYDVTRIGTMCDDHHHDRVRWQRESGLYFTSGHISKENKHSCLGPRCINTTMLSRET